MSVSRQTVSKWETDEITPELNKLILLCDLFSCKLDALIRENLTDHNEIYSAIAVKTIKGFRMARYVAAYILPDGFQTSYPGVEYADQIDAEYAVITIHNPFAAAFERIPNAYKKIMEYLQANGFREKPRDNILSCFEYVYEKNGQTCMDVHIHTESISKTDAFTNFS